MLAIIKKELNHFFSSTIGFVFILSFLVTTGLFLWVFSGNFNIIDNGFASLTPFFELAPWVFLLLIPAACMQSFAEEKKLGTLELLLTKPINTYTLIFGKYLGVCFIILLAILPTLIYVIAIDQLALSPIDFGSTIGSYVALFLLGMSYAAIGIFSSACTQNQTVALLIAIVLCFLSFFGINNLVDLGVPQSIDFWGIAFHYDRISQGVIDTRDVLYFICFCLLFIGATLLVFNIKNKTIDYKKIGVFIGIISLVLILGNYQYFRFDLTKDKRFTLSETSKNILKKIQTPLVIDILLEGKLPPEFKKLQRETKQLLTSFTAENPNIKFAFINPLQPEEIRAQNIEKLQAAGLTPVEVSTKYEGVLKKEMVIPWAMAYSGKKSLKIALLKNKIGATTSERVTSSVQNLEYAFTNAIQQLTTNKTKKIAYLKGNGQLNDIYVADCLKSLQSYYHIAPFTLDSVNKSPNKTLKDLLNYDLIINAKPTQVFSETEKLVLDQHLLAGKNQVLLFDKVAAEKDSIFINKDNKTIAWNRDLHLKDLLFAYGIRINPQLVNDYYSDPIVLASGNGSNTQYTPYNWGFSGLSLTNSAHPITQNIIPVRFNFSSPIDTLKNNTKKTILLQSSPITKLVGVPTVLDLKEITNPLPKQTYTKGTHNLAILLEAPFKSAYKNRVLPFKYNNYKPETSTGKLMIVSDGDIIKNEISKGQPMQLGFDPITKKNYGNKEFLINSINYILADKGLVELRNKEIKISVLDPEKLILNKKAWQWLTLLLPVFIIGLGYLLFSIYRKKKYKH